MWAPVELATVVGYMQPNAPGNEDKDDKLQLYITNHEICGVCNGSKVRIEGLGRPGPNFAPLVASVQLQLAAASARSSQDVEQIDIEHEAERLESAVYLNQFMQPPQAGNAVLTDGQLPPKAGCPQQHTAQVVMPYAPATLASTPATAPHVTYEPDSHTCVPLELSLEALFHLTGNTTSDTKCQAKIGSTMCARLRTVAQQLELLFESSKSTPTGACIAHYKLPGQAIPLSVLYPMPMSTAAADERTEALQQWRYMLHSATLCSTERPLFRLGQRLRFGALLPVFCALSEWRSLRT